ncbi:MAG: xylulokinase [Spirochaetales bacterium]|nr:xylulokinase [Spirochaetales bacterium]
MAVIAGIDNGTQSTKVLVYDSLTKKTLAIASSPHQIISRDDGTREQMASWWIDALKDCFSQIDKAIRFSIQAIGVSGQQHGFVPVSETGEVLAPVKLWCDTSTIEECEIITEKLGGADKAIKTTGNEIKPGYTASKVLYLKRHNIDAYKKMRWIMLPHDYLNYILTDNPTMEYGDASGTAFFDVKTRKWSKAVLDAIDEERDLAKCLPPLIRFDQESGKVSSKAAKMFGIPEGIPVSCGGGDNMMGAIGTGTVCEGDLTMSMGTSGTLYGISSDPVVDPEGRLAAFCSSTDTFLPLLCTMNCTVSSEVTRALFKDDIAAFNAEAEKAPIGCEGVQMLPFFNGERTPNYPNGTGCIFGFNLTNMTRSNICRSAMESSVYAMKYGLDAFVSLGFKPQRIKLIGGGSKSALWRQMVSDVFNLPVSIPENSEAAAFGAALQALFAFEKANGKNISIEQITGEHVKMDESKLCKPNSENHKAYETVYASWLEKVKAVAPLFS